MINKQFVANLKRTAKVAKYFSQIIIIIKIFSLKAVDYSIKNFRQLYGATTRL